VGEKTLPTAIVEQVIAKTDGVPLFVEELVKMIVESDLVQEQAGRYVLTGLLPPLAIPSSLHDSLMARLDRLSTARELVQLGAVLGREFAYDLLQAVAPVYERTLQQGLAQLVGAELVYQRGLPPRSRIQGSSGTVKAFHNRLPPASLQDEGRLGRRTTVWLDLLVHLVPLALWGERWGLRASWLSDGPRALLWHGRGRVVDRQGGGRRPQLPPKQKQRVGELLAAGPLLGGLAPAGWTSGRSRGRRWRAWGGLAKRPEVCTVRPHVGCACHKARLVAAHREAVQRLVGLEKPWPPGLWAAKRGHGLSVFAEEASVAQVGALRDPWARRGQPPEVPTRGKGKGSQGCGAIA
jgi:hypothetical protein